jgi:hypothetical protein
MKHLKTFEGVFETDMESYTNLAKEICYELEDEGYDVEVKSELTTPDWAREGIKKGHTVSYKERLLDITISKKGWFDYNDVKETCDRLIDVMGDSLHWSTSKSIRQPMRLDGNVKVHYYLRSDRFRGKFMSMPYQGGSMWVKVVTRDLSEDDKNDCLQTKVVLKFR